MIISNATLDALRTDFSQLFWGAYKGPEVWWPKLATRVASKSKSNTYGWVAQQAALREWIGPRQARNLSEHSYTIINKPFEGTFDVDRDDIEDDNLGQYTGIIIPDLAQATKKHPDQLLAAQFVANPKAHDGVAFFNGSHSDFNGGTFSNDAGGGGTKWYLADCTRPVKPFIYQVRREPNFVSRVDPADPRVYDLRQFSFGTDYRGQVGVSLPFLCSRSGQTLTDTNVAALWEAMAAFKGENGQPLGVNARTLVVPPSLYLAALQINQSTIIAKALQNVAATENVALAGVTNVLQGWFDVAMIPELS